MLISSRQVTRKVREISSFKRRLFHPEPVATFTSSVLRGFDLQTDESTTAFLSGRAGQTGLLIACHAGNGSRAGLLEGLWVVSVLSRSPLHHPPPHQPIGRGRWAGGRWSPALGPHPAQGPTKHPANIPRPLVQSAAPNGRRLPPAQTPRAHGAKQGQVIRGRKVVAVGTRWHGGM